MHLQHPLLPLFNYPVAGIVDALPDELSPLWDRIQLRQSRFGVHAQTRSMIFAWLENNWQPGMALEVVCPLGHPRALAVAVQAFASALLEHRAGRVVKLMLVELAAGGTITPHTDRAAALTCVHRCHLPILTSESVRFDIDGVAHYLAAGTAYEFDNTRVHGVRNLGSSRRVHLICDVMPPQYRRELPASVRDRHGGH